MRKRFLKPTLRTKWITQSEKALKTVAENSVGSCVHFCLRSLGPLERCVVVDYCSEEAEIHFKLKVQDNPIDFTLIDTLILQVNAIFVISHLTSWKKCGSITRRFTMESPAFVPSATNPKRDSCCPLTTTPARRNTRLSASKMRMATTSTSPALPSRDKG